MLKTRLLDKDNPILINTLVLIVLCIAFSQCTPINTREKRYSFSNGPGYIYLDKLGFRIAMNTASCGHPDPDPDLCQDSSVDVITRINDGSTFVFKGYHYWKVETNGLAVGYPRSIRDWGGLPDHLDAVLTWPNGKTFFFKGDNYWRFSNMGIDQGYPKLISRGFPGIPDNVDAAFVWSGNGKTYFFKGNDYWRYSKSDPSVSKQYPKSISDWKGLPNNIDTAFKWENGMTYFFKGSQYFRYNDVDNEVDTKANPPFPRQTAQWFFNCPASNGTNKRIPESPNRSGGLVEDETDSYFVDNYDNHLDYLSDNQTAQPLSKP